MPIFSKSQGTPPGRHFWRDYENTYVEFHLENLTDTMEEGDYSVQLFVNGNPVETVDFTVQ